MTKQNTVHAINCMLYPKSIAIIGASADANKLNGRPFYFMRRDKFGGRIYPVNPRYDEIHGVTCYPDIAALPEPPDLAIVAIPAVHCKDAIVQLGQKGCPIAVVFSSGFGETGEVGRVMERELLNAAQENGIRICGPNNLGLINSFNNMSATFSQYADLPPIPGPVAFATQSGAFGTGIAALARSRGIGIGYFVNTGNQIDINLMEVLETAIDDERINVIAAYLEGVTNADALIRLANKAMNLVKPFIVVKVGRQAAGARATLSHTGALAGNDAVFDDIARQYGIIRVRNEQQMVDLMATFSFTKVPLGKGVAIVTQSGGAGAMMADRAEELGYKLPVPSGQTRARLQELIPTYGSYGNPIDVTGQFLADPRILKGSVEIVLDDPAFDIAVVWLQLMHGYADFLLDIFCTLKERVSKPFIVCWIEPPDKIRDAFNEIGICLITGTEQVIDAVSGLIEFGCACKRCAEQESPIFSSKPLNSYESTRLPSKIVYEMMTSAGLPVVKCAFASNSDAAAAAADKLGYPVAVKIESSQISHKSDVGGVALDLTSADEVRTTVSEMFSMINVTRPGLRVDGVLLQSMVPAQTEIIVGMRRDPVFGPILMIGLGGVFVEVFKDTVFARIPVSSADAYYMLENIDGREVLDGVRGKNAVNRELITKLLVAVSNFALKYPEIEELDLNPVLAGPDGVTVVDWLATGTFLLDRT
ncbi:MAG: CoA-binding protein [Magnetovibrio sp.]|nr:CoA-binding protein [Magnetovibrio sp.]